MEGGSLAQGRDGKVYLPPLFHDVKQSVGAGKNEKQSQFANLGLESQSTKSEIRNNIKCPENQILETNVKC